ncbi:unnamed protein product [Discosporangium mesarthrocarpum]
MMARSQIPSSRPYFSGQGLEVRGDGCKAGKCALRVGLGWKFPCCHGGGVHNAECTHSTAPLDFTCFLFFYARAASVPCVCVHICLSLNFLFGSSTSFSLKRRLQPAEKVVLLQPALP